jgi:hypothetical protein
LLSLTYQQACVDRPVASQIDPENRLYWRGNRRRLEFEPTRDALFAVSGTLDQRLGGPSMNSLVDVNAPRRTLYGQIDRLNLPGLFRTYDFPDPNTTSPRRDQTTVAPQALFLLNHPIAQQLAQRLARRSDLTASNQTVPRVTRLYQLCFARAPSTQELDLAVDFLRLQTDSERAWIDLAHALLLSNEFVFVD